MQRCTAMPVWGCLNHLCFHTFCIKWLRLSKVIMQTRVAKVRLLFGLCKAFEGKNVQGECKKANLLVFLPSRSHFYAKSEEMKAVFNRCWVYRDAKCGICKPKFKGQGRVERGSFTLTLSQNRAWKSPLTRLFTLYALCICFFHHILLFV